MYQFLWVIWLIMESSDLDAVNVLAGNQQEMAVCFIFSCACGWPFWEAECLTRCICDQYRICIFQIRRALFMTQCSPSDGVGDSWQRIRTIVNHTSTFQENRPSCRHDPIEGHWTYISLWFWLMEHHIPPILKADCLCPCSNHNGDTRQRDGQSSVNTTCFLYQSYFLDTLWRHLSVFRNINAKKGRQTCWLKRKSSKWKWPAVEERLALRGSIAHLFT